MEVLLINIFGELEVWYDRFDFINGCVSDKIISDEKEIDNILKEYPDFHKSPN